MCAFISDRLTTVEGGNLTNPSLLQCLRKLMAVGASAQVLFPKVSMADPGANAEGHPSVRGH